MKIGRNDPCPCGSSKKYKKCCLRKDTSSINSKNTFVQESEFDYIAPNAESLYDRIKDYDFEESNHCNFLFEFMETKSICIGTSINIAFDIIDGQTVWQRAYQ